MRKPERKGFSSRQKVEDEIAHLRDLDLTALRARWLNEFSRTAPKHLTRHLLFRVLAYKVQADRFGDLDAATSKVLDRTSKGDGKAAAVSQKLARLDQRRFAPPAGTVLVREWDRKSHRVMVLADGFAWNGQTFESLSQVAFAITGTKWNGPRFFGLRDRLPRTTAGEAR
jgi:Protein of unknown function (DUF2924)